MKQIKQEWGTNMAWAMNTKNNFFLHLNFTVKCKIWLFGYFFRGCFWGAYFRGSFFHGKYFS